jgi:hypothetical protein
MSVPIDRLADLLGLTAGERTALYDLDNHLTRWAEAEPLYTADQIPTAGDSLSLFRKLEDTGLLEVNAHFPRRQWNFSVVRRFLTYLRRRQSAMPDRMGFAATRTAYVWTRAFYD